VIKYLKMKKTIILVLPILILFSGCNNNPNREDILAPACEGRGGITGCLGKSGIKDIKIEPATLCLNIKANNCNGGVLGVENKCDSDLKLNDIIVPANKYQLIEFARDSNGKVVVLAPKGNFDSYNPEDQDTLSYQGKLGELSLTITYTKKNVCGKTKNKWQPLIQ
tara:strand:+ start:106 stop:603 length:498 start_codon:yes stop_codon:yes gene_type:complete